MLILLVIGAAQATNSNVPNREDKIAGFNLLVTTFENDREWNESTRLVAVSVAKDIGDYWKACLRQSEERLRRSTESVETVATAILGSCLPEEHVYQRAVAASLRGLADPMQRTAEAEKLVGELRATRREEMISDLVNDRLPPSKAKSKDRK